jgi:hypothetical protein
MPQTVTSGAIVARFSADGAIFACATVPDGKTLVASDGLGRVHFLRLVEP